MRANYNKGSQAFRNSGFRLYRLQLLLLLLICLVAPAGAQNPPEHFAQFDPTDFLVPYLKDDEPQTPGILLLIEKLEAEANEQATTELELTDDPNNPDAQGSATDESEAPSLFDHQLWLDKITVPESPDELADRADLQQLIDKINSIEVKSLHATPGSGIFLEFDTKAEPNDSLKPAAKEQTPQEEPLEAKSIIDDKTHGTAALLYKPVAERTLQTLRDIAKQHPEKLNRPFELAEIMFLSGNYQDAVVLYEEALERSSSDEKSRAGADWIVFQMANCLRHTNPTRATELYNKLVAQYPNSPWGDLAKAQRKLIEWYQQDKPETLIAESGL